MSKATVRDILKQIDQLSSKQRDLLERRLAEQRDQAWEEELQNERAKAKRDGITDDAINRAVMELRRETRRSK